MVLLNGTNYDYSGQVDTFLTTAVAAAGVGLVVANTEGFAADDYFVVDAGKETSEVIKITSVTDDTTLVIGAAKFAHAINAKVYRLPYNQMKFYESETVDGTYVVIASSTTDLDYATNFTTYDDVTGDNEYYFKRTFYNSNADVESDIGLSNYWQTDDEILYLTPDQLRSFMQLGKNDFPTTSDMRSFILLAQDKLSFDVSSSDIKLLRFATFLLSKAFILRGLATKSVAKGYVTINAEGRQITKSFQELVLEAENTNQEYLTFLMNNARSEVSSTNFMDDASLVSPYTKRAFKYNWSGTQNAMDYDNSSKIIYSRRSSR